MSLIDFIILGISASPLLMRGGRFHDLLINQASDTLAAQGWNVSLEHPLPLPDGKTNFVDIYVTPTPTSEQEVGATSPLKSSTNLPLITLTPLLIEVETTPRYAAVNIAKAQQLGLPVWLLTPTRKVRSTILRRLNLRDTRSKDVIWQGKTNPICILLHAQFSQALSLYSAFLFRGESLHQRAGKQENKLNTNNRPRNKSPP